MGSEIYPRFHYRMNIKALLILIDISGYHINFEQLPQYFSRKNLPLYSLSFYSIILLYFCLYFLKSPQSVNRSSSIVFSVTISFLMTIELPFSFALFNFSDYLWLPHMWSCSLFSNRCERKVESIWKSIQTG